MGREGGWLRETETYHPVSSWSRGCPDIRVMSRIICAVANMFTHLPTRFGMINLIIYLYSVQIYVVTLEENFVENCHLFIITILSEHEHIHTRTHTNMHTHTRT